MKFVDRTKERNFMKELMNKMIKGQEMCIWIEGTRGAGKSYFIKYLMSESDIPVYKYFDQSWCYKCSESTLDNEYQFFVEIICDFQRKHPKDFNDFLVKYFNNIYDISWIETLAYVIPNIKLTEWAKNVVQKPLEQVEQAKNDVSNMLYKSGLRKFLAEAVIFYLNKIENKENIVFFIDDACWLDQSSINAIVLMLNTIKTNKEKSIHISFVILTRPQDELVNGKENYILLENSLKDVYGEIKYIKINNFDYHATREYIELMDKDYKQEVTHYIFNVTSGNPQELFQSLKFNDFDIKEIMQIHNGSNDENYMSAELLIRLASQNVYCFPVICSISMLHQKMKKSWLALIIKSFCNEVINEEFNILKYDKCLELLLDNNIINNNMDIVEIVHDSIKETAIDYIKGSGEYSLYMNCLTDTLKSFTSYKDLFLKEIMQLYSEYDPNKCFDFFVETLDDAIFFEDAILRPAAKSLSVEKSLYTIKNITTYIVPVILDGCVRMSYYDFGYTICTLIWDCIQELPRNILYRYYVYFAKILIDIGKLQKTEEYSAIQIIELIERLPNLQSNEHVEICLLAMSAYEHLLDFDNIRKYNITAQKIVYNDNVDILYRAMYLRNQGLVESHSKLKNEYVQAIICSEKIEKSYEKFLMLGTCQNNLGLHYLYLANVETAFNHFKSAQKYLEQIGYDTFRVLNNIAICYLILGKNDAAYDYLLQAKNLNLNCIFEKICVQNNIALLEYKLGKTETAKDMLIHIIEEYQKNLKQTDDDLVYSSAMVNLAYIYYMEHDYANSAKWYKASMFFNYRYDDNLQKKKRQDMMKLNMYGLGLDDMPQIFIDISDEGTNLFKKMYALIPFAYYVI